MIEETNDNTQEADGNLGHESVQANQLDTAVLEKNDVPAEEELSNTENQNGGDAISQTNAEESEDETLKERHDIPMQDYDTLSLESLVEELKSLVSNEKVMSVKEHVEEIKKAFLAKYNHLLEEKKEEFLAENQDPNEEFQYHSPLKTKFDQYYSIFRNTKNAHLKILQTKPKSNFKKSLELV